MIENIDCVIIDNMEYGIVSKLKIDGIVYAYLVNLNNIEDIIIKKIINENGEDYLIGLDDEDEFNKALVKFTEQELTN